MKMSYSVVIPAYNEERRITRTLDSYLQYFSKKHADFEIIVVCDGCSDRTSDIVRSFVKRSSRVKLLAPEKRLGKGGGILKGFEAATGDVIGFVDADGSVGPEDLFGMMELCEGKKRAVIGSRNMQNSVIHNRAPPYRRILSRIFSFYVNALFGLSISDTQCGAKALTKDIAKPLVHSVKSKGFEFDVEVLWRIKKNGGSLTEYPVRWSHTTFSTFKMKNGPGMALRLLLTRLGG